MGQVEVPASMALIRTDRTVAESSLVVVVEVDGTLDSAASQELCYVVEAAAFVHSPCEVHLRLAGAELDGRQGAFVSAMVAAHATASRRSCRLSVCQPPQPLQPILSEHGLVVCDGRAGCAAP